MGGEKQAKDLVARPLKDYPHLLEELFRFSEPDVRARALANLNKLDLGELTKLADRAKYITLTRIVHRPTPPPERCRDKVIYRDEAHARAKAKEIWQAGRGAMRVYACPLCEGYHLTHQAYMPKTP